MLKELDKQLKRKIRKYEIPGASVAVLRGSRIIARAAAGVGNLDTKVPATTDTLFQIGSITKPITATMIMQLRDEGRLELDAPVLTYLPKFRVADMKRLRKVSIRHLLSHSSGIDGDFFPPTDSGERAIEQYLDMCSMLPFLFEPGSNYSYSNAGFAALGRVIEILDGRPYDDSLKARVFDPLGMQRAMSKPQDNIRFRVAVGHVPGPHRSHKPIVPAETYLSFGLKSAGSTPAMTAEDLLKFAAIQMHGGTGLNGAKPLSKRAAQEMQRPQLRTVTGKRPNQPHIALGWHTAKWRGEDKIIYHGGGTIGQYSQLIVCPGKRLATVILTNGGKAGRLFEDVGIGLFKSLAGISPQPTETPDNVRARPNELVGNYENIAAIVTVSTSKGKVYVSASSKLDDESVENQPLTFLAPRLALERGEPVEFDPKGQKAEWLRWGKRLLNRVGS